MLFELHSIMEIQTVKRLHQ